MSDPGRVVCVQCDECAWCGESGGTIPIPTVHAAGVASVSRWHRACLLRNVLGSAAHLEGRCSCHGGAAGDPPELTRREAAELVARAWGGTP